MLRTTITKAARPAFMRSSRAAFTTTTRALSSGDTGAPPKTGGYGCVCFFLVVFNNCLPRYLYLGQSECSRPPQPQSYLPTY